VWIRTGSYPKRAKIESSIPIVSHKWGSVGKNKNGTNLLDPTQVPGVVDGMVRRSTPQHKIDDQAFPVRVKFAIPKDKGTWWPLSSRVTEWLKREFAPGDYSSRGGSGWNAGHQVTAYYFRTVTDAQRFVDAFPEFELADGTMAAWYTSPELPFGRR
jgi:hypothetical protein